MSLNPHGPHLARAEVDMILDVPMQDGATYARGRVIVANDDRFVVELETLFPGQRMTLAQGAAGVVKVSDG